MILLDKHGEDVITGILNASGEIDLTDELDRVIGAWGFKGFTHLDIGRPEVDLPYYVMTAGKAWEQCYIENNFVKHDAVLSQARRQNRAFRWSDVPIPQVRSGPKRGSRLVMEAAYDHGFEEGVVFPHHSVDPLGRPRSALTVLFWKDRAGRIDDSLRQRLCEMHLIIPLWQDRMAEFIWKKPVAVFGEQESGGNAPLSDREREVLAWAARGKTVEDTAAILGLAIDTVENQIRSAIRKLGCLNKTHAVARAIYLCAIDP